MYKSIANQKTEITKEEFEYYKLLENEFGKDSFIGLFKTNNDGKIVTITPVPQKQISMAVMFFAFNLMHNQRLRAFDSVIKKYEYYETRIDALEKEIVSLKKRETNEV